MTRTVRALVIGSLALLAAAPAASAATRPTITTGAATAVTAHTAKLAGSVNPNGSATTFFFQFGSSTRYGYGTTASSAGSGKKALQVTASLTNLTPDTTYHYRLVALNSGGTSYGKDKTFKTPPIPTTASIDVRPNPAAFGGTIVASGRLSGPPGVAARQVALYGNPFPYTGGFKQVGNTVLTTETGAYTFTVAGLAVDTQFEVVDQSDPAVTSPVVLEQVTAAVRLSAHRLRGHGDRVRFTGTVAPGMRGALVLIKRRTHGRWVTVARARTRSRSGLLSVFRRGVRLARGGRFEAVVIPRGGNAPGRSRPVVVH